MPSTQELTERQRQVLDFIIRSLHERGSPPTIREISVHLNLHSPRTVQKHLLALNRKGFIQLHPRQSRGIELTRKVLSRSVGGVVQVPIIGKVAAGQPILAEESVEDTLLVDSSLLEGKEEVFALRVKGDSMKDKGVLDGDVVLIRPQPTAQRGDIVCVLIQGYEAEATLKGFFPETSHVTFQPANREYQPIIIPKHSNIEWRIIGKMVGLIRKGEQRMSDWK